MGICECFRDLSCQVQTQEHGVLLIPRSGALNIDAERENTIRNGGNLCYYRRTTITSDIWLSKSLLGTHNRCCEGNLWQYHLQVILMSYFLEEEQTFYLRKMKWDRPVETIMNKLKP